MSREDHRRYDSALEKIRSEAAQLSKSEKKGSLWQLWEVAAVMLGAALSLEATAIWPRLYWPGVVVVYGGFSGLFYDAVRGRWPKHWFARFVIAAIAVALCASWTFGFVFAKADLSATSRANAEELRLYLLNDSDYDFNHITLTLFSGGSVVTRVAQFEPVCQDFRSFVGPPPIYLNLRDNATGKDEEVFPSGPTTISNRVHVMCSELPRHSTADFVVALMATDAGKDPNNPFPKQFSAPKRLPESCSVDGEYRALGKTRHFHFTWTY